MHKKIFFILCCSLFLLVSVFDVRGDVGACEIRQNSCNSGEVAVAKTSSSFNAHASLLHYPHFNYYLCCDERILLPEWGSSTEMFSIADDAGQGHVSAPGVFPQPVTGNWNACTIKETCVPDFGEVCMAQVSEAGVIDGAVQGHIYSCSDTTPGLNSICCCPSGTTYNPVSESCVEFASFIDITSFSGPSEAIQESDHLYTATISWGGIPSSIEYRFYELSRSSNTPYGDWFEVDEFSDTDYLVSSLITFSDSGARKVCVQAKRTVPGELIDTVCIDVDVSDPSSVCSLSNCRSINPDYIAHGCIDPFSSVFDPSTEWTPEPSLSCAVPLQCNCAVCADGYVHNGISCVLNEEYPLTIHNFSIYTAVSPLILGFDFDRIDAFAPLSGDVLVNAPAA